MKPVAKEGEQVVGTDTHIVMIPAPPGPPVPTPLPHPFVGKLDGALASKTMAENKKVALVGSTATNTPHIPQGGPFQKPPADKGKVSMGSQKVEIENKAVARMGDPVTCCNDPADLDTGSIIAVGKVLVG